MKVLNGIKVLDLSTVLAGPSVGSFLAELGAEVTKFESPSGDVTRTWFQAHESKSTVSAYFSSVNAHKSYQTIDLNQKTDREIIYAAIKKADVLLMNFKAKDYIKFGLRDEELKELNERLIVGKISGFGQDSDRVAFDLILQAETGWMSMNGQQNSPPTKMPVALIDVLAAHHLKEGILLALYQRERSQQGAVLNVSLYDAAVLSLTNQASNYLKTKKVPGRQGSLHPNIAPYGEIFETSDKHQVTFAIGSDRQFENLCEILGLPDLPKDENFHSNVNRVKHRETLKAYLSEKIARYSSNEILEKCHEHHVPAAKIMDLSEVFTSDQAQSLIVEETTENESIQKLKHFAVRWS